MSPLERFPQEQTDAPSDSGALRLNLSGGGLCWRLPFCRAELHRALSAMLRAAGSGPAELVFTFLILIEGKKTNLCFSVIIVINKLSCLLTDQLSCTCIIICIGYIVCVGMHAITHNHDSCILCIFDSTFHRININRRNDNSVLFLLDRNPRSVQPV